MIYDVKLDCELDMGLPSMPPRLNESAALPRATTTVIADVLRDAIGHGVLGAGEPLRQDQIAAQFNVSHIPVREALKELVAEGLATRAHNRGVVVSELSPEFAWELTELRCLLEGQMARWAVPNLTPDDLDRASGILDALDGATEIDGLLSLNADFHVALYEQAARPLILKTVQEARINLNRYLPLVWQQLGHVDRSQNEHRRILELCRKGDAAKVGQLVERHILSTGRLIVGFLKNRELGGPGAGTHD